MQKEEISLWSSDFVMHYKTLNHSHQRWTKKSCWTVPSFHFFCCQWSVDEAQYWGSVWRQWISTQQRSDMADWAAWIAESVHHLPILWTWQIIAMWWLHINPQWEWRPAQVLRTREAWGYSPVPRLHCGEKDHSEVWDQCKWKWYGILSSPHIDCEHLLPETTDYCEQTNQLFIVFYILWYVLHCTCILYLYICKFYRKHQSFIWFYYTTEAGSFTLN